MNRNEVVNTAGISHIARRMKTLPTLAFPRASLCCRLRAFPVLPNRLRRPQARDEHNRRLLHRLPKPDTRPEKLVIWGDTAPSTRPTPTIASSRIASSEDSASASV